MGSRGTSNMYMTGGRNWTLVFLGNDQVLSLDKKGKGGSQKVARESGARKETRPFSFWCIFKMKKATSTNY